MKTAAAVLAVLLATTPTAPSPDGGLSQTVDPNQSQATGRVVLDTGHVDIGPRLQDGRWSIQIHDDHAVPSVWREPADTVLHVRDTALLEVPDDPAYAFLGAQPGEKVHVVPQTEKQGVVWIGWNTQDPAVMQAISRGVTLSLRGAQGPGDVTVYLQSGNLGAPQVLWNTAKPLPQPLWVETNTHTHANWVFTKPGNYQLAVDVTADLADGSTASASTMLRLAVGDATAPDYDTAFTAPPAAASGSAAAAAPDAREASSSFAAPALIGAGALAVLIIGGLVFRQSTVRRRAEREREATR
ncbi:choice-of-anchor M domain-containing protein [Actinoplanes sp. G11-F43]|uniref:choice-of-anchor M domain-containing protein n=1 Tax=Actinoplanes sp. G11-F43 TaxID=3424130 RepID=UPI003D32BE95